MTQILNHRQAKSVMMSLACCKMSAIKVGYIEKGVHHLGQKLALFKWLCSSCAREFYQDGWGMLIGTY